MNVLSLPVEIVQDSILTLLRWNDLLRLRRTCKAAKQLVKDYVRSNPDRAPELEINGNGERGLRQFVAMGICTRKVFLNTNNCSILVRVPVSVSRGFMEQHVSSITVLRVNTFSLQCPERMRKTLELFVNLRNLTVDNLIVKPGMQPNLPVSFQHIRHLNLKWTSQISSPGILEPVMMGLKELEHVQVSCPETSPLHYSSTFLRGLFVMYISVIQRRSTAGEGWTQLKTIDFGEALPDLFSSPNTTQLFHRLCIICAENRIRLSNVREEWLSSPNIRDLPVVQREQLGMPILSMVSYWFPNSLRILPLPIMEKLVVHRSLVANFDHADRCNSPTLKYMNITIRDTPAMAVTYLFQDANLLALTELTLNVVDFVDGFVEYLADRLPGACRNLKKLSLMGLSGNCSRLVALWEGLAKLEDVSLVRCSGLRDSSFIGSDADNPTFLSLTKMRKLTLGDLDLMPGVTDDFFTRVVSRMKLSHLMMWCAQLPLTSITKRGIASLLDGPFAESVEEFPFKNIKLRRVSMEKLKQLETKFRCNASV